ncbi:hypothetical protein KSZ_33210 [Dictyobacter formicarum]|uniref:Uncharacterized protein n=1 Tax=Dictyobacter formicarum TaxID=2778368 RepID=A0ABQ3VH00_9CHLR|nr:hypothetical protein KSZ_33210 [Dictyobacter formicarum]
MTGKPGGDKTMLSLFNKEDKDERRAYEYDTEGWKSVFFYNNTDL